MRAPGTLDPNSPPFKSSYSTNDPRNFRVQVSERDLETSHVWEQRQAIDPSRRYIVVASYGHWHANFVDISPGGNQMDLALGWSDAITGAGQGEAYLLTGCHDD